ncbi:MAG: hypothetical protein QXL20_06325, partial [Candidatus Bathyarchaeia archaeon]
MSHIPAIEATVRNRAVLNPDEAFPVASFPAVSPNMNEWNISGVRSVLFSVMYGIVAPAIDVISL